MGTLKRLRWQERRRDDEDRNPYKNYAKEDIDEIKDYEIRLEDGFNIIEANE
jgi:hypothetical protein